MDDGVRRFRVEVPPDGADPSLARAGTANRIAVIYPHQLILTYFQ
jgi:hypothetical protein